MSIILAMDSRNLTILMFWTPVNVPRQIDIYAEMSLGAIETDRFSIFPGEVKISLHRSLNSGTIHSQFGEFDCFRCGPQFPSANLILAA
jgi:hypothetical protein